MVNIPSNLLFKMIKGLKIGQKVKIVKIVDGNNESKDRIFWGPEMDEFKDKIATIEKTPLDRLGNLYKLDIDKGEWTWSVYWLRPINHKYHKQKYAVGTPNDLTSCINIDELKDTMSLKLSEEKSEDIIGFKLIPIYKIRSLKRDVKFTKCSSGQTRHTSDLVK